MLYKTKPLKPFIKSINELIDKLRPHFIDNPMFYTKGESLILKNVKRDIGVEIFITDIIETKENRMYIIKDTTFESMHVKHPYVYLQEIMTIENVLKKYKDNQITVYSENQLKHAKSNDYVIISEIFKTKANKIEIKWSTKYLKFIETNNIQFKYNIHYKPEICHYCENFDPKTFYQELLNKHG